jgi:hypothetical protein
MLCYPKQLTSLWISERSDVPLGSVSSVVVWFGNTWICVLCCRNCKAVWSGDTWICVAQIARQFGQEIHGAFVFCAAETAKQFHSCDWSKFAYVTHWIATPCRYVVSCCTQQWQGNMHVAVIGLPPDGWRLALLFVTFSLQLKTVITVRCSYDQLCPLTI